MKLLPTKTSPLEDDDLVEEEAIEVNKTKSLGNDLEDKSLENNEIINIKELKSHPLDNVIGNLNQRTLRSQAQDKSIFIVFFHHRTANSNDALQDDNAFRSFFGEEHQTFKLKMFHNLDQLRLQLERENLHGVNAKTCLQALRTPVQGIYLASKGWLDQSLKTTCIQQIRDLKLSCKEEDRTICVKQLMLGWLSPDKLVGHKPTKQDTSSSLGNYTTHVVDADIGPVNDQVPFAEEYHKESYGSNDMVYAYYLEDVGNGTRQNQDSNHRGYGLTEHMHSMLYTKT
ncbi:hypothetical protein Tco_1577219 [Tanacetum coccineum]